MFSKKLNFDIVEKDPNTYYVIKDPNKPPYAITVTKRDAIEYILPFADAYLNGELGLVKDPIGRHDNHNDYYSQTHAAKEAPDFNRGRNWRTAWGK